MTRAFLGDCMDFMREKPDKFWDLAIVDPPYGIGEDWKKRTKRFKDTSYKNNELPELDYFDELFRTSKNQIIWGYNYYAHILGPTNYLICWDKQSSASDILKFSMFELAYSSFRVPAKMVTFPWDGNRMGIETGVEKIHPHQKPISLYRWLLKQYAKPGDKILDTHLGSGSHRIAAYDLNLDFTGYEKDPTHFEAQEKRFKQHISQLTLQL